MNAQPRKDLSNIVILAMKRQPHGEIVQFTVRCDLCGAVKTVRRRPLLMTDRSFSKLCRTCGLASAD